MKTTIKKFKFIVSMGLILIIIGSIAVPVLAKNDTIGEGVTLEKNALHVNQNKLEVKQSLHTPQKNMMKIDTPTQTKDPLLTIKAKSIENRKHRLHKQDEFNYIQKDVEQLLLSGVTLEDIYLSDQIGNEWLLNPKDLIDKKTRENKTWVELEQNVTLEKQKLLKDLQLKHPNIGNKLAGQTMNIAEQLEILQDIDTNNVEVSDVIEAFKTSGRAGVQKLHSKRDLNKGDQQ